ncbi:MAG: CBS domain-containing protein [Burkholderiaceae bacterium]
MILADVMTPNPVCVGLDEPIGAVKAIFDRVAFRHVLVVDEGSVVGIVSDRDLLKMISPNVGTNAMTLSLTATLHRPVSQIATRKPHTLGPAASIADAVALFNAHRISCIPIVGENDEPLGVVSWRDIFRHWKADIGDC